MLFSSINSSFLFVIKKSGVANDPCMAFYTEVTKFSYLCRYQYNIGTGYGHKVNEAESFEYVPRDGCIICDGVRGGDDSAIYQRWNKNPACSDNFIQDDMSGQR